MRNASIRFIDPNTDKNQFFPSLRKEVDSYFKDRQLSKYSNSSMVVKTVVLFSLYILPFIALLAFNPPLIVSLSLWAFMGFAMAGIGMSVMHDANHGSYSKNPQVNKILGFSLNMLGGSVFNWKIQHNILHHTYTNISHVDDDIADKLILKLSPNTSVKWYHKFQVLYAFLFYSIVTLYWATLKDFLQFKRYIKDGMNKNTPSENRTILLKMILDKILYFSILILLPIYGFGIPAGQVLGGFLLMHAIAGIILTVIFQLAHTVEGTSHPLPNEANVIENSWAIHQLNTTVNFSGKNKFLTWYLGGLNYQIEHHLFPNICHIHYPAISKIVRSACQKFEIPYLETKSFWSAVRSHIKTLKRFGVRVSLDEAVN